MSTHWVFNECDEFVKASLRTYWATKWPRLEKLLTSYRPDQLDVRMTATCHRKNPLRLWYDLHGVIKLPTGTLVADEEDTDPRPALDGVVDKLHEELRKHKELVRKDYLFKRKNRPQTDLSAAGSQSPRDKGKRRKDFFSLFRPLLPTLRDQAKSRIRALEQIGALHVNELTVADLLDETLERAWSHFDDRPKGLPTEKWLTHIMEDVLEEWIKQEPRPHTALDEEVRDTVPAEAPQVGDQQWWAWLLGYDESVALHDIVPGSNGTELWDRLDVKEQAERIRTLVNELPPTQRQTFVLYAIEDFAPFEIAMIQDRSEEEVKADIEAARRTLASRLSAEKLAQTASPQLTLEA